MSFEIRDGHMTANSDFNDPGRKATAVFFLRLFAAGVDAPADLDPRLNQQVVTDIAPDVDPGRITEIAQKADFIVRYS